MKIVVTLIALTLLPCAFAVDGVVLINQSTVTAAGGFPYTISAAGSYRLSGNLMPPLDTSGINIAADGVTLDLNGFAIIGNSSGPFVGSRGIVDVGRRTGITIRNGSITGFPYSIYLRNSKYMLIELMNLNALIGTYPGDTITVGYPFSSSGIVRGNVSKGGITVTCPARVADNVATFYNFNILLSGATCIETDNVMTSILEP